MTTGAFSDNGTWGYSTSPGASLAFATSPTTGGLPSLTVTIDVTTIGTYSVAFAAPASVNKTIISDGNGLQYDGLKENFTLILKNHTGQTISGFAVALVEAYPVADADLQDYHPHDYAHFHNIASTTFPGFVTTQYGPGNIIALSRSAGDSPATNQVTSTGILYNNQTISATGITLHQEETPLSERPNNNFTLNVMIASSAATDFAIAAISASKPEGNSGTTPFTFTVTRSGNTALVSTISYGVTGSGTNPAAAADFTGGVLPSGTVSFASGETTKIISIPVAGDTTVKPSETFTVALTGAAGVTFSGRSATGTILNDDGITAGASTVYRFFDTNSGTHFLTASSAEKDGLVSTRKDLIYEGIGLTAANPATDANAAPVYRFFDTVYGTHFFTSSKAEADAVAASRSDLTAEGIGFYEHMTKQSGDSTVYRFFDTVRGTHFYTADAAERATIISTRADLHDEGIGFYAPALS